MTDVSNAKIFPVDELKKYTIGGRKTYSRGTSTTTGNEFEPVGWILVLLKVVPAMRAGGAVGCYKKFTVRLPKQNTMIGAGNEAGTAILLTRG